MRLSIGQEVQTCWSLPGAKAKKSSSEIRRSRMASSALPRSKETESGWLLISHVRSKSIDAKSQIRSSRPNHPSSEQSAQPAASNRARHDSQTRSCNNPGGLPTLGSLHSESPPVQTYSNSIRSGRSRCSAATSSPTLCFGIAGSVTTICSGSMSYSIFMYRASRSRRS